MTTAQAAESSDRRTYCYEYPRPAVSVDVVALSFHRASLQLLLVRRRHAPFAGRWALPGGFVEMDEDLTSAAARELEEETSLTGVDLTQLGAFGAPNRDPRGRVISVAHLALLSPHQRQNARLQPGSDAADAAWLAMAELPELAFDHDEIIACALKRLRADWDVCGAALALLPETFTLTQVKLLGQALRFGPADAEESGRTLLARGVIEEAGVETDDPPGTAKLYRHRSAGPALCRE